MLNFGRIDGLETHHLPQYVSDGPQHGVHCFLEWRKWHLMPLFRKNLQDLKVSDLLTILSSVEGHNTSDQQSERLNWESSKGANTQSKTVTKTIVPRMV